MQKACPSCSRPIDGTPPSPPQCVCGAALPPRDLAEFLADIGEPLPVARGALPFGGAGSGTDVDRDSGSDTIRVDHKKRKA